MLGLEQLDKQSRAELAARFGASGDGVRVLERYLLVPARVSARASALSGQGRDALWGLLSAAQGRLLLESLDPGAVEALQRAWLVHVDDVSVSVCDEVATACLTTFGDDLSPCRLRLLLSRGAEVVEGDEGHGFVLERNLARLLGEAETSARVPGTTRVCEWLGDGRRLATLLNQVSTGEESLLWEVVAAGGVASRSWVGERPCDELLSLGLLWAQGETLTIAAEVLRGLLTLRLERQWRRASEACNGLAAEGRSGNVLIFPNNPARGLSEVVNALKEGVQSREALLGRVSRSASEHLEGLLGLLISRGDVSAGRELRWDGLSAGASAGSMGWSESFLEEVEREGWWSQHAVQRALAKMLGHDLGVTLELPEEDALLMWAAAPPEMLDVSSEEYPGGAGLAVATQSLGMLLKGLFGQLQVGCRYELRSLCLVLRRLVGVAQGIARLEGPLYMKDQQVPGVEALQAPLEAWLSSLAAPLGWVCLLREVKERGQGETLPLFSEPVSSPGGGNPGTAKAVQVTRRVRHKLEWPERGWDWAVPGGRASQRERLSQNLVRFEEELAAFREDSDLQSGEHLLTVFETFMKEETSAKQLCEVTAREVEAFFNYGLWKLSPPDNRRRVQQCFDVVERVFTWRRARGGEIPFEFAALRGALEGQLLRLCSVLKAVRVYHNPVPPGRLLREAPAQSHDGLVVVLRCDPSAGVLEVARCVEAPSGAGAVCVQLDPRPLALLRRGDLMDVQLVRYGEAHWLTILRRVWPGQALEFLV